MPRVEMLFNSNQMQTDGDVKTSSAEFLVYGLEGELLSPDEALYAEGVPKLLAEQGTLNASPYPGDETLKADSKSVTQRINCNTYIVTVNYSNNGKFGTIERENNISIQFQTGTEEMDIPFLTKDLIVYPPVAQGQVPVQEKRWQTRTLKFKATFVDMVIGCRYDDLQAQTDVELIASMVGNWHKLGNRDNTGNYAEDYWRFMGGDANSIDLVPRKNTAPINRVGDVYRYQIQYRWRQRRSFTIGGNPFKDVVNNAQDVKYLDSVINQFHIPAVGMNTTTNEPYLYVVHLDPLRNIRVEQEFFNLPGFPWRR